IKQTSGDLTYALYGADDTGNPPAAWIRSGSTDQESRGTNILPLNTWSFLSATYDGTTLKLYVNAVQVGSKTIGGNIVTSNDVFRIGGNSVWGEYFSGLIDEVRIYNRALSNAEIEGDMCTPILAGTGMAAEPEPLAALNIYQPPTNWSKRPLDSNSDVLQ